MAAQNRRRALKTDARSACALSSLGAIEKEKCPEKIAMWTQALTDSNTRQTTNEDPDFILVAVYWLLNCPPQTTF